MMQEGAHLGVAAAPVVACPASMFRHVDVLVIVQLGKGRVEDAVDHARLQVKQDGPRDVVLVVCLVEEHVFPVDTLDCIFFQDPLCKKYIYMHTHTYIHTQAHTHTQTSTHTYTHKHTHIHTHTHI